MSKILEAVIVGGGLSGLAIAHFLKKFAPTIEPLILEKGGRPGGAISSFQEAGFLAEWGPHGFLDNIEESRELLDDTGLAREAQRAELGKFVRYICLNGKLRLIPQNPKKIIASSLISLPAKFRVLGDLFKKPLAEEQTVSQWVAHRFGAALLPFADAVFTGTYAGDFERLSIDATMPGIRQLELANGSVIRGLIKKRKTAKKGRRGLPAMISFSQGMGRLPEALARGRNLRLNIAVDRLEKLDDIWKIVAGQETFQARNVLLALSINQGLQLLAESGLKPPVAQIPEARIANVVMGFGDRAEIPFGFGYLAPEQEKRFALGALFSSHMFPGRAPAGHVLLEALVGGRRHPEKLELSDAELINRTYDDLKELLHLPEPPGFARVLRPAQGIPQPESGFSQLGNWRRETEQAQKGLYINGFGWGGIGINDMIKEARKTARAAAQNKTAAGDAAAVKNIYF